MTPKTASQQERQQALKKMIRKLHEGASVDEVKKEFAALLSQGDSVEIVELEQALIAEGLPETEIKRLCDVHVAVFRESLDSTTAPGAEGGDFLGLLREENHAAEGALTALEDAIASGRWATAREFLAEVQKLDRHYRRKEYSLFPRLEKHGFTGPASVMWAIHDDIRAGWKNLESALAGNPDTASIQAVSKPLTQSIRDMFYKEEKILFPAAVRMLADAEWAAMNQPGGGTVQTRVQETSPGDAIPLQVGSLTPDQIALMLTNLPVDVTFVDPDNNVRFYSGGRQRIFERTPDVIGRNVMRCHPPASVHRVKRILDDFHDGKRDVAEFWIQMGPEARGGRFIHIRYFALRDSGGKFQGTIEITQDVTAIRKLQGERRLLAEEG
jgi:DUF438 domain-containing protein